MNAHTDICIRGAGIVGRTLALLLAQQSIRVTLVDASASSSSSPSSPSASGHSDVRAYALNAASKTLIESLRCWPEAPAVTAIERMEIWGDAGGHVCFDAERAHAHALGWIVDVPALEQRLAEAVRFQPAITVVQEPVAARLTVICEGKFSATRSQWGVRFEPQPYPQHALACRVKAEEPHGQTARQWFAQDEDSGAARILGLLPLGGETASDLAVVWSLPPEEAARWQQAPADEFETALSEASQNVWGALRLTSERKVWPLMIGRASHWVGSCPGLPGQSFALAGDAAHAMHPLAGQGLNVGLGDVAELARVLGAKEYWRSYSDLRLLRRYERARQPDVLAMLGATDALQRLFSQPGTAWQTLRNWGFNGFNRLEPVKHWVAQRALQH